VADRAEIRVDDGTTVTPVWKNHLRIPHIDNASLPGTWQDFEIEITEAAGTSDTVSIEWHLKSDSSLHAGGWAIDDVEIFTIGAVQ
jgi:hypothetical protein